MRSSAAAGPESLSTDLGGAASDRRRMKALIHGLFDHDMRVRFSSAKALGELSRGRPDLIRRMWPRIFYAFDDTMSCWGAAEGLGEIARNMPELRDKLILHLKKFQRDEASCQGYVWAVTRVGQVEREKVSGLIADLAGYLDSGDTCMVGQAIWALGELGLKDAAERIKGFLEDPRETWIYGNEDVSVRSIADIATEALEKLKATGP
jgi:hypothetical protein